MQTNIYHERQTRQLCALHTLNNLFQGQQSYTKEQLDQICNDLSPNVWINPHRSPLGLGNYDINVIMTALEMRNCEAIWFDKRKDPSCINLNAIVGFILNVPSDYKLAFVTLPLQKRHWIAIRRIDGKYYNLDSKLREPDCIGDETDLLSYLRSQLETNKRELFVIVKKTMANGEQHHPNWIKGETNVLKIIKEQSCWLGCYGFANIYCTSVKNMRKSLYKCSVRHIWLKTLIQ